MNESQRFGKSLSFILFLALVFGNPIAIHTAFASGHPGGGGGETVDCAIGSPTEGQKIQRGPSLASNGTCDALTSGTIRLFNPSGNEVSSAAWSVPAGSTTWSADLDAPDPSFVRGNHTLKLMLGTNQEPEDTVTFEFI